MKVDASANMVMLQELGIIDLAQPMWDEWPITVADPENAVRYMMEAGGAGGMGGRLAESIGEENGGDASMDGGSTGVAEGANNVADHSTGVVEGAGSTGVVVEGLISKVGGTTSNGVRTSGVVEETNEKTGGLHPAGRGGKKSPTSQRDVDVLRSLLREAEAGRMVGNSPRRSLLAAAHAAISGQKVLIKEGGRKAAVPEDNAEDSPAVGTGSFKKTDFRTYSPRHKLIIELSTCATNRKNQRELITIQKSPALNLLFSCPQIVGWIPTCSSTPVGRKPDAS